jgi:hypothetical protein
MLRVTLDLSRRASNDTLLIQPFDCVIIESHDLSLKLLTNDNYSPPGAKAAQEGAQTTLAQNRPGVKPLR